MAAGDWESYFIPGTRVLRNRLGLTDGSALERAEGQAVALREQQLRSGRVRVQGSFGAGHLRALHRHLFADVYDWAGQYRTVSMSKPGTDFPAPERIERFLEAARSAASTRDWARLDADAFAEAMAEVYAPLNHAHPFREGNGRTGRAYLDTVAEQSPFVLDHSKVPKQVWDQRSMFSGPDIGSSQLHPDELVPVFAVMTTLRPATAVAPALTPEQHALAEQHRRLQQAMGPTGSRPTTPGVGREAADDVRPAPRSRPSPTRPGHDQDKGGGVQR